MKLLNQLYKVHSPSNHEEPMRLFIQNWILNNVVDVHMHTDKHGNIFVRKGDSETYPCVVAHMDEVHDVRPKGFKIVVYKDNYILGGDTELLRPCGIGADDKNGIWVALKLLQEFDAVKAAFFVGEEIGCVGSSKCDMAFFKDCRFVLQADRKGGTDFIDTASGVELCGKPFKSAMQLSKYGFNPANGLSTDVMTLKQRGLPVACANVSCGYYNPHTHDEYTSFYELDNCLDFFRHAFKTITEVQKHKYVAKYGLPSYNTQGKYAFPSYMSGYRDDDSTDMKYRGGYGGGYRSQFEDDGFFK